MKNLQYLEENNITLKQYLQNIEKRFIIEAMETAKGNKTIAASLLGIKRTTLVMRLKGLKMEVKSENMV